MKIFKNKLNLYLLILITIFLLTRVPLLHHDIVNVDEPAWNYRSKQFYTYLKQLDFGETYRSYHPGVTLMWLSGLGIEIFSNIYKLQTGLRPDYGNYLSFPFEHFSSVFPLVLFFLFAIIATYKALSRIIDEKFSFIFCLFLILEPFFVANTRVLHLDGLMTISMLNAVLFSYLYFYKEKKIKYLIFSAFFSTFAILSKVPSVFILLFIPFFSFIFLLQKVLKKNNLKKGIMGYLKDNLIFVFLVCFFFILLFPAMWVRPLEIVKKIIFNGVLGTGGGEQGAYFFGKNVGDPGPLFYVFTLLYRVSPLLFVTLILGKITFLFNLIIRKRFTDKEKLFLVSAFFIVLYFAQMALSIKKIDRYVVPLFPFMVYFAVYFIDSIKEKISLKYISLFIIFQFLVLSRGLFPDYFLYFNPIFGGISESYKIFGALDWGAGYYKVANYLNRQNDIDSSKVIVAAFNDSSLSPYYKGLTVQIDSAEGQFNKVDYVVTPPNDSYGKKALDLGFTLEKIIYEGNFPYWFIYRNHDKSVKEYIF